MPSLHPVVHPRALRARDPLLRRSSRLHRLPFRNTRVVTLRPHPHNNGRHAGLGALMWGVR